MKPDHHIAQVKFEHRSHTLDALDHASRNCGEEQLGGIERILTPARQVSLIQNLAACGCAREACAKVDISADDIPGPRPRAGAPPLASGDIGTFHSVGA